MEGKRGVSMSRRFADACADLGRAIMLEGGRAMVADATVRRRAFDRFLRATQADWTWMARTIAANWGRGSRMDEGDIVQELYAAAWQRMTRFDLDRAGNVDRFPEFLYLQSFAYAKDAVRVQRPGGRAKKKGYKLRMDVYFEDQSAEASPFEAMIDRDDPESILMMIEGGDRALSTARTKDEYAVISAIRDANGDIEIATLAIVQTGFATDEDDARKVILRSLRTVVSRMEGRVSAPPPPTSADDVRVPLAFMAFI